MAQRAKMTRWYDPPRLVSIAIRVAVSTVFGEFADRREGMAAAREIDPMHANAQIRGSTLSAALADPQVTNF